MKHNNVIPNGHFKKKWQNYVKTWFNQPARKIRRRNARAEKARKVFPRPVDGPLRPAVRCQTVRYNMKQRLGRGFSLEELKEAGISKKVAPTIGIAVDHRRRNKSLEAMQENVNRLKAYKSNLVIFPRRQNKPKAGDASAEELKTASQLTGKLMPIKATKAPMEYMAITDEMKGFNAYAQLRLERMNKRLEGIRKKRAEQKAQEEKDAAMK
uniref:60S ribosomal protein L13 n=2 Tax=Tetraselmis sp. GSL018 TaxID=582737 RepID=A0A061RM48_9CHLO|mmetsp:Transcript_32807/g.77772  ORF Transcript_32807/g.77772 Transcript_32807/m.77772 type:complete len:211 (+) Transcript_32807:63-695(+)|eukprot:CAMPEP_0177579602 /NCGR_PEP_ID=MMETSP0419_2-20121207/1054_1 /TAXON_ID=582737 /ORGANISM="Tetraselmis sp., Strain GSL018" /LENGTH=210 /DNA_ID=CAMNT_0019068293 /DNA_START=68 /DNA_END=700 /DNA_ORIENTATION=+